MALVGYARVSSVGQSLEVQLDKLNQCHKIFQEKKSAASGKRPRLEDCLEYVREGDTLVVTRLDRLARSTLHLCQIAAELERKRVSLQVIDQNINTNDATGRLLFQYARRYRSVRDRDTGRTTDGWYSKSKGTRGKVWQKQEVKPEANC